jgi:hypothetical protein
MLRKLITTGCSQNVVLPRERTTIGFNEEACINKEYYYIGLITEVRTHVVLLLALTDNLVLLQSITTESGIGMLWRHPCSVLPLAVMMFTVLSGRITTLGFVTSSVEEVATQVM